MANAFTPTSIRTMYYGGPQGKNLKFVEGTLVIDTTATGGAVPDDLPASMFGLKKIVGIAAIVNDGEDKNWFGTPDYTGDSLLVGGGASNAPMDLPNDTYKIALQGTW